MNRPARLAGCLLLLAGLAGCGRSTDGPRSRPSTTVTDGAVVATSPAPGSASYPAGTLGRRITYRSGPDERVSGLVLVPPGRAPAGGWPVVAWDHGTTGIGDDCAPSRMPGAAYPTQLGAFLRAGYAVAATDYPGLGTPGVHPYLDGAAAARSTVDIVRAAHRLDPHVSTRWAAVGHSQGGQAAWFAGQLTDRQRAGTDYRGAIALAPAPNFGPLLSTLRGSTDPLVQEFLLLLLTGLDATAPVDLTRYLGPQARAALPAARTVCFDDLTKLIARRHIPGRDILPGAGELPRLARALKPREIGHRHIHGPLLVLQGEADAVVPPTSTRREVAEQRHRGDAVTLRMIPGATHGTVLRSGWPAVTAWLVDHLS